VVSFLSLTVGLAVLVGGGYLVVEGASSLARRLGVSKLTVGLTVVAFGTSAPELAVNLSAAVRGDADIAFGNIIGSNIANIGLILGLAAIIGTLAIHSQLITRELPLLLLATAGAAIMALDPLLRGGQAVYDRTDGLLLLLLFAVFMYGMVRDVLPRRDTDSLIKASEDTRPPTARWTLPVSIALTVLGLGLLVAGGDVTVRGAEGVALSLNLPASVIGLTIVAVGTSLPELVTSVVAGIRQEADIAVGNIVGSNIFNLLFILGITATVRPIPVPASGNIDIIALALFTAVLVPFSLTNGRCIGRTEGVALLVLWIAYVALRLGLLGPLGPVGTT
jgi:cation:H+ antiporter